jgi:hypothetical protein
MGGLRAAPQVFSMSYRFKVIGVHAQLIAAQVVKF